MDEIPTSPVRTRPLQCPNCGANVDARTARCDYCRAVLSVTACPACFAPMFKGMRFCPHCGTEASRATEASGRRLACPRCAEPLSAVKVGDTRIDECDRCGGIWLDAETFERICAERERQESVLVHARPVEADPGLKPAMVGDPGRMERMYVPCPACGELMNRRNFAGCSGVILDWCKPHGFWFDREELQRIVRFVQTGGLQKARDRERAELEHERRRLDAQRHASGAHELDLPERSSLRSLQNGPSVVSVIIDIIRKFV